MSEYQYYDFRALDRRLTPEQQKRLRSLSSRAEISATRFTNEYSYGDLRGNPGRLLEEYFDAYLHAANWGTRELAFRLPRALLDGHIARRYCDEEYRAWVTETDDLIAAAAEASGPLTPVSDAEIADWVTALPTSDKDNFLTMVAEGEGTQVEALLAQRFRRESRPPDMAAASTGRTAGELLAGTEARRADREAAKARAREEARTLRAAEQAAAYERRLEKLSGSKDEAWRQVEKLTMFSKPKEYDQATQLLKDLHEIARRQDDTAAFTARVRELRTRYAKRPSLMERLQGRPAPAGVTAAAVPRIRAAGSSGVAPSSRFGRYRGSVLDLDNLDLGDIADALADQFGGYEHLMLIHPQTGETVYWSADTGIDGSTPIDLDELLEERELIGIHPLPSWVWYQDMADFAEGISDEQVGRRLERAIRGKGAFRRFKDELHQGYPDLLPAWYEFHDTRALRRAVEWLAEQSLIDEAAADRYLASHPGPGLP